MKFSIRTLLIVTTVIALHVGLPFLAKAFFATLVAAILFNFVSAIPLAAIGAIWNLAKGDSLTDHNKSMEWVGYVYVTLLVIVYVGVAVAALYGVV